MKLRILRRSLSFLILLSSLPLLASAQSKDEVTVEVDRFTEVVTIAGPVRKVNPNLYLNFAVFWEKAKSPLFSLEIITSHPLKGANFSHKEFDHVYFILDGEKRLTIVLWKYLPEVLGSSISETARMHLTEEEFNRLTSAKKIEAQWGNTEFEFDKKSLADFPKVKELYEAEARKRADKPSLPKA